MSPHNSEMSHKRNTHMGFMSHSLHMAGEEYVLSLGEIFASGVSSYYKVLETL